LPFGNTVIADVPTKSFDFVPTRLFDAETTPLQPVSPSQYVTAPAFTAAPLSQKKQRTTKSPPGSGTTASSEVRRADLVIRRCCP
jgi:hypothetical protein